MKLPSGQEVKNETLSEIADSIALDMMTMENTYSGSCSVVAGELEDGYGGEHETLPGLDEADSNFLLEAIRIPTLKYLEKLRLSRSTLFGSHLKSRDWEPKGEEAVVPILQCPHCGEELHDIYHARSVKLEWGDSGWIESDVYSSGFSTVCCSGELTEDELIAMGRPYYCEE